MSNFIRKKNAAIAYIDSCIGFAKAHGYLEQVEALADINDELSKAKVVVIVIGEARRGKSTLLSSFLEDTELLPVNVDVTTCTVTAVTYGEEEKITVIFGDNSQKVISRAEIAQYADESRNSGNAKGVTLIEIETPNKNLREGVTFVDTPGVGSVNPLHTEATLNVMPYANAVLFVTDAFQPITESELEFLRGVKRHCENFIFVLTKIDAVPDYEQIAENNKNKIHEYAGIDKDSIICIPVSAELKLAGLAENDETLIEAGNIAALEDAVWSNIEKNQEDLLLIPPMNAVAGILNKIAEDLRAKSTVLFGQSSDQRQLSAEYQDKLAKINRLQNDSRLWDRIIKDESENTAARFQQRINEFKSDIDRKIDEIAISKKRQKPAVLVNKFVMAVSRTKEDLDQIMADGLFAAVEHLEKETEFNLSGGLSPVVLPKQAVPTIRVKKEGLLGKIFTAGSRSLMGGAGGTLAGKAVGGVIGGIIGTLALPGPGTVGAAVLGEEIGGWIGGTLGSIWGVTKGIGDINAQSAPQIQMQLRTYINSTITVWNAEYRGYAPVFRKLGENLSDEFIRIKNDTMQEINEAKQLIAADETSRSKSVIKFKAISTDFDTLKKRFNTVLN